MSIEKMIISFSVLVVSLFDQLLLKSYSKMLHHFIYIHKLGKTGFRVKAENNEAV